MSSGCSVGEIQGGPAAKLDDPLELQKVGLGKKEVRSGTLRGELLSGERAGGRPLQCLVITSDCMCWVIQTHCLPFLPTLALLGGWPMWTASVNNLASAWQNRQFTSRSRQTRESQGYLFPRFLPAWSWLITAFISTESHGFHQTAPLRVPCGRLLPWLAPLDPTWPY